MRWVWLVWSAGCTIPAVPSSDVATRDLQLWTDSRDEGEGMALSLTVSGPEGPLTFDGSDELQILAGGEPLALEQPEEGLYTAPLGDFEGELELLVRREGDHNVEVQIPVAPTLQITAQTSAEGLQVNWEPEPGEHTLVLGVEGPCVSTVSRPLAVDTGYYSLSRAEFAGEDACALFVSLVATVTYSGELVPDEEGGTHSGTSSRISGVGVEWGP